MNTNLLRCSVLEELSFVNLPQNIKFLFSTFPCHSFKIFPTHKGKVLLSKTMQQNLPQKKYDLEPGSTQVPQAGAKGDRVRDRAGDEATIYGQGVHAGDKLPTE